MIARPGVARGRDIEPSATKLGSAADFEPPRLLAGRHLQSVLPTLRMARAGRMQALSSTEILDCGAARLLGFRTMHSTGARGLVVLLHGWEGCAESHYMLASANLLFDAGFDVFRLNFRDHGGTQALNRGLFHSCRIDEVVAAVAALARPLAGAPLFLVGFSLGGNFALRVAVRAPAAGVVGLRRVVAVCPVLEPRHTMSALEQGLWIYRRYFLRRWRSSLRAKARAFPELYDFGRLERFPTLTATTDFFVRRYTDFEDLDSYLSGYAVTGAALRGLALDTRVIAASDDPVIPSADLARLASSPALTVSVTRRGGHCGFVEDYRLRGWIAGRILAELTDAS